MEPGGSFERKPLKQSRLDEAFIAGKIFKPDPTIGAPPEPPPNITPAPSESLVGNSTTCSPNNDPSSVLTVERIAPTITSPQSSEGQESSCLRVDLVAPSGESFTVSENPPEAQVWMGEALALLKSPSYPLPTLCCRTGHRIFFTCYGSEFNPRVPYPSSYTDNWSERFVRMPCSPESLYPIMENGKKDLVVRWTLIEKKLREPINSLQKLQDAILSYNERFKSAWNFSILRDVIENDVPDGNLGSFFRDSLPALCALALNLPIYLTQPIPLMRSGCEMSFTFSQLQIASLLANAFFCTFPRRNSRGRNAEFARFPFINFSRLFSGPQNTYSLFRGYNSQREKIRCLLHYFHRVTRTVPTGTVTYTRRCLGNLVPDWSKSTRTFDQLRIHINSQSTIEEAGVNTLQVDFANKFLGGGVLSSGCVQEEIMFVLRPELLATCLFVECLGDDEAVLIEGAETYSQSSGYADTFKWTGDFSESHSGMERDEWCRWKTTVVAIDATYFSSPKAQFTPEMIQRELNKAYCGFTDDLAPGRKLPSVVATGNWGCGAFRGNVDLKALIQMMACVQAGKSLAYFTFGDKALLAKLYDMYIFLSSNSVTVAELWSILSTLDNTPRDKPDGLYAYIKQRITVSRSN
ncbi:Poly(ADP-ribose) glycohydrolase [Clonorchis sinensis]|uniref:poly(ADP-ribose) glycohydrolase n=1 Tax=Clonorchis sinensis TaxID=79923 RepID=A0A8T1M568_CLOSI|nr:Poly(ADP-ribose) glycohydrolase [Clonorchis sinensis]